jgi:hypothetical protein
VAQDALDPGPDGSYPYWPRKPDGSWDEERMPAGNRPARDSRGRRIVINLTVHRPDGTPIVPPDLEFPD